MNMMKQVGAVQNVFLKHAYKYQITYPLGKNVSDSHQSCPSYITILDINDTESGPLSARLLTQCMLVAVYQHFATACHSLNNGTDKLSCNTSKLPTYTA
jgi:hypothetical protein